MPRLRTLAGLVVLAVAGTLITPTAALAATQLKAFITCDATTGAITTSASGTLLAAGTPTRVTVEFQRRTASRVTATAVPAVPAMPQPFTTTVLTTSSGDISATGYTSTFDPVSSLFYQEKLVVTFKNATTGTFLTTREATCSHDLRTTVTLTCDPVSGTVTGTVDGINGQAGSSVGYGQVGSVRYRSARINQGTKTDPRFREEMLPPNWDLNHRVTRAADGTWTDTGFVHRPISAAPYYYAEELTVGVFDVNGFLVGGGTAKCVLFDGSVPTP